MSMQLRGRAPALVFGLSVLVFAQGCLSSSYEVSRSELARLASLAPEERARRVHVVQQTSLENDIDEAERQRVNGWYWGNWHASFRDADHEYDDDGEDTGDDDSGSAAEAVAVAAAVVALAATAAVTVAASEGARYDGWVAAEPGQPLLLIDQGGKRRWSSLAELSARDLRHVSHGVLPEVSDGFEYLGRRPLDRRGAFYQFELGSAVVGSALGEPAWGYAARIALGYMPTQRFGISIGWAPSVLERYGGSLHTSESELTFESRGFVQAELWPLALGRLHAGLYGELGHAWVLRDDPLGSRSAEGWSPGAGLALQLDWTTRLALTVRGGLAFVPALDPGVAAAQSRRIAPAITLGVSVY